MPIPNPVHPFITDAHFRKWGWADEQGWIRSLKVPMCDDNQFAKYSGNPVLAELASGLWDSDCMTPCVIYKDGKYWLFYMGYNRGAGGWGITGQIGVAYATSPEGPYTRSASNPIVPRVAGTFADALISPAVIYDDIAGLWKMWVTGESTGGAMTLGYSTASDPEGPWSALTQVDTNIFQATVARFENQYICYYGQPNLALATSPDGLTWTLRGNVITLGAAGQWDDNWINYCGLFWNLGVFYIYYSGSRSPGWISDIGFAQSPYAQTGFTKWVANPSLRRGAGGTWDDGQVQSPSLLMMNSKFYLWYHGWDGVTAQQIGVACLPAW